MDRRFLAPLVVVVDVREVEKRGVAGFCLFFVELQLVLVSLALLLVSSSIIIFPLVSRTLSLLVSLLELEWELEGEF